MVGALFDLNFDSMVTAKIIKIIYVLAMVPISLVSLTLAWYGLAYIEQEYAVLGLVALVSAPLLWLLQVLMTRVVLEFMINQFKISEYLRAIKDKS